MKSLKIALITSLLPLQIYALSNAEVAKIQAVSDEWRNTYKFDRETYDELQASITAVIDTHALLERENIDPVLKEKLEDMQRKALQKVVNQGEKFLPFVIREFTQTLAAREKDKELKAMNDEVRRTVMKNLRLKEQALEAAIISMGLAAIPNLSDLQARALRKNSDPLAKRIKGLLSSIVKREELEKESAKLVSEAPEAKNTETTSVATELPTAPTLNTVKTPSIQTEAGSN